MKFCLFIVLIAVGLCDEKLYDFNIEVPMLGYTLSGVIYDDTDFLGIQSGTKPTFKGTFSDGQGNTKSISGIISEEEPLLGDLSKIEMQGRADGCPSLRI